jgi:hypothetical protein
MVPLRKLVIFNARLAGRVTAVRSKVVVLPLVTDDAG